MKVDRQAVHGLMMEMPLTVSSLIRHAARWHGGTGIVSRLLDGSVHRYTYRDLHARCRQLANYLTAAEVLPGERIATLAWNGHRHLELYFAVSGVGAICHTINPRLFPEQIAYIINHAQDTQVYFEASFAELVTSIAPKCKSVKRWVLLADRPEMPRSGGIESKWRCYEDEIAQHDDKFTWPQIDERLAASLCYTSGTTGNPKGVLYSHRSIVLHALALALPDVMNASALDVAMPVVPMFHVNAWGMPYACAATGTSLVLPGAHLDPQSLYTLIEDEEVTHSAGVPTIWHALLAFMERNDLRFTMLRRVLVGGAALPKATLRAYRERLDVELVHAWGMTEMSPLGTSCTPLRKHRTLSADQRFDLLSKQGHVPYGVDMKIVGECGEELPHDGRTFGSLMVRGPWVASSYYRDDDRDDDRESFAGGWFDTGDVATIDPDGFMEITDRAKDVIKSGGEWISSITLESIAMSHPGVAEAAVVAVPHPRWDERPLLVVVPKSSSRVSRIELLEFFEGKVAKWWIPEDVVLVDCLPHNATGKMMKALLRKTFAGHLASGAAP